MTPASDAHHARRWEPVQGLRKVAGAALLMLIALVSADSAMG